MTDYTGLFSSVALCRAGVWPIGIALSGLRSRLRVSAIQITPDGAQFSVLLLSVA
jgi:hypothetical protein